MAGLGEVCTHIAAVLFYLEAAYQIKKVETCTEVNCPWAMPSFLSKIEYRPTKDFGKVLLITYFYVHQELYMYVTGYIYGCVLPYS